MSYDKKQEPTYDMKMLDWLKNEYQQEFDRIGQESLPTFDEMQNHIELALTYFSRYTKEHNNSSIMPGHIWEILFESMVGWGDLTGYLSKPHVFETSDKHPAIPPVEKQKRIHASNMLRRIERRTIRHVDDNKPKYERYNTRQKLKSVTNVDDSVLDTKYYIENDDYCLKDMIDTLCSGKESSIVAGYYIDSKEEYELAKEHDISQCRIAAILSGAVNKFAPIYAE